MAEHGATPPTTASEERDGSLLRSSVFPAHLVLPVQAPRTGYDLQARKAQNRAAAAAAAAAVATVSRPGGGGAAASSGVVRPQPEGSNFYIDPRGQPKSRTLSLRAAIESRPPLQVDMEIPGPQSYSAHHVKPLNETNAPAYTMRPRCWTEKEKGSRTAWTKTWFQTPDVFGSKVDFYSDNRWPSPTTYTAKMDLGQKQATLTEYPAFTMGYKTRGAFGEAVQAENTPSATAYDADRADRFIRRRAPALTHSFRHGGTALWLSREVTPGPATYSPRHRLALRSTPCFSMKKAQRRLTDLPQLGPFSSF